MELLQSDSEEDVLAELQKVKTVECMNKFLIVQRDIFCCQVDQLQKIVVFQCKVTGVNPLSQEMAAGALSINIGKKPRDLLNPKAVKYLQSVFAVKDVVSKKETREISALCGITVTQVRDFFSCQRSRIRTLVRLAREKNTNSNDSGETVGDCPMASPEKQLNQEEKVSIHGNQFNQVPMEAAEAHRPKEEMMPGSEVDDDRFLEQIFGLMKKESTFLGQMKLMEWILQIHTPTVLLWFLNKGGVSILGGWLSDAAVEEQTSIILTIFKVLCHLPMHKAPPAQMSALLQTVNKLRFYRTSDISNKARVLLSRWSKLFIRSHGLKRPATIKYASEDQKDMIRRQRIREILSDGSWGPKIDLPDDILSLKNGSSDLCRSFDDKKTIKKSVSTVACPKVKEKRKVLLVEQPDSRNQGRNVPVTRPALAKGSRPMSSDDIQKAKMHAIFMQRKYSNSDAQPATNPISPPDLSVTSTVDSDSNPSTSEKPTISAPSVGEVITKARRPSEKGRRDSIHWRTPPVVRMNELWSVGGGESSKEVAIQSARVRREQEAFYGRPEAIPFNPKEPWDVEMDFDDSLTPEIPMEPPPDADVDTCADAPSSDDAAAVPDLELLAVLLKNPQLVFALTSGQSCGLSSNETVALLDVLKRATGAESLPSPTPASGSSRPSMWETTLPAPPLLQAPPPPPLLPTLPRPQSPVLGRLRNGLREFPHHQNVAPYPATRPLMSAPYLDRTRARVPQLGEAWSPDRSFRPNEPPWPPGRYRNS